MGDLDGEADFTLYSSTIHAGDIGSDSEIAMKYSKAYMENLKDVDFDLYDSDVIFENSGDLTVSSKYSKFEAKNTGKMDIKSYDDKFKVALVSNVNIETKYSDFEFSSDINKVELDFYDSNFSAGNVEQCTYQGKYSELIFVSVKNLDISNSYDDKFELGKTKQVKVTESKYSDYLLKQSSSFLLDGYDDNITIEKLSDGFEGPINVNGKYIKLDIDSDNEPYQVYFNINMQRSICQQMFKSVSELKKVAILN
ncbi:MAG: hypothetical protein HQ541_09350 [Mariniphaga sp.]|nr:hypothetical protein [Mariniphaga sp.]